MSRGGFPEVSCRTYISSIVVLVAGYLAGGLACWLADWLAGWLARFLGGLDGFARWMAGNNIISSQGEIKIFAALRAEKKL